MNFIQNIFPSHLAKPLGSKDILSAQRETSLQAALNLFLISSIVAIPFLLQQFNDPAYTSLLPVMLFLMIVFLGLAVSRSLHYGLRAGVLVGLLYLTGVIFLARNGLSGGGMLLMLLSTVLAGFLFSPRICAAITILNVGSVAIIGQQMVTQRLPMPPVEFQQNSAQPQAWIMLGVVFTIGSLLSYLINRVVTHSLIFTTKKEQDLTNQLEKQQIEMDQRVNERSADLRKRLAQFEVANQIARDMSAEVNLSTLLNDAVRLIRDRFGFYHAAIYLNDERNEYTTLTAVTEVAGNSLLERNSRLKVSPDNAIGYAIQTSEARIVQNTVEENAYQQNPLLPDTRSEAALPLRAGTTRIGVLDLQSVTEHAFSAEEMNVLQTIADQLATAVHQTRLTQQLQESLQETERIQQENTRQTWQAHLKTSRRRFAYRYAQARLEPAIGESAQARKAVQQGESVLKVSQSNQAGHTRPITVLAVPIKLRNQVLGVVDIQFESGSVSPDLIALIKSTVDRLAVSLENARLLEEIQERAERERLVSEITSKVRASSEVDNILRIAAQELGRSLGVSEVLVQLRNS